MRSMMEPLETRSLLSATSPVTLIGDLSQLSTDAAALRAQFVQYGPTMRADLQALRADVRAAGMAGHGLMLAALNGASARFYATTRADTLRLIAADSAVARRGFVEALRLLVHPTNILLQAKVQADAAAFSTATTALMNKLGADGAALGAASAAALDAVGATFAGNATVTADIARIESDGSTFMTGLAAPLQAVQNDLSKFLTDLAGG